MSLIKHKKIHRELIEQISNESCKYYTIFDSMYKASECEMEYIESDKNISMQKYRDIHKFYVQSGAPVMQLNSVKGNSMFYKLYGNYKTMYEKMSNDTLTPEKMYNKYINIINATWFYSSQTTFPKDLYEYNEQTVERTFNNFVKIIEVILGSEISKDNNEFIRDEFFKLFKKTLNVPVRFLHGNLSLDNILVYHDKFKLINFENASVGPFLFDFTMLITDMCHKFGDDFEMVFVKDYYETSKHFFDEEILEDDFFITYKILQLFILINSSLSILENDTIDRKFVVFELKTEVKNMMKYTVKHSEFRAFWDRYNLIMG